MRRNGSDDKEHLFGIFWDTIWLYKWFILVCQKVTFSDHKQVFAVMHVDLVQFTLCDGNWIEKNAFPLACVTEVFCCLQVVEIVAHACLLVHTTRWLIGCFISQWSVNQCTEIFSVFIFCWTAEKFGPGQDGFALDTSLWKGGFSVKYNIYINL